MTLLIGFTFIIILIVKYFGLFRLAAILQQAVRDEKKEKKEFLMFA